MVVHIVLHLLGLLDGQRFLRAVMRIKHASGCPGMDMFLYIPTLLKYAVLRLFGLPAGTIGAALPKATVQPLCRQLEQMSRRRVFRH